MSKSNQKLLVINYIYNTAYNILAIVLPIISVPYVTRRIDSNVLGTYNYTQSIVYFFVLFGTLGMNIFAQREIACYRDDKLKRDKVFWEMFLFRILSVSVSLAAYLFFIFSFQTYCILYLIQVLDILAAMFDITWFFQGQEDFKKPAIRNIIIKVLIPLLTFILVKSEKDIYIYVLIHSGLQFAGVLSLWGFCKGKLGKCCWKELHPLRYTKGIILLFIPQLVVQVYSTIAKPMLGLFTDTAQVACYEQALKIIKIVTTLITAIGTVLLPRMSKEFQDKDQKGIQLYMKASYQIVGLLGCPLMVGLGVISSTMVAWFYGDSYAEVGTLIRLLCPIILVNGVSNLTSMQFLIPAKKQKEYIFSVVCGSIANVILNLFLIARYGARGAAVASLMSELLVLACQIILIRKEINLIAELWNIKKYLLYSCIMGVIVWISTRHLGATVGATVIQGTCGLAVYVTLLFLTKDQYVNKILNELRKKVRRKGDTL